MYMPTRDRSWHAACKYVSADGTRKKQRSHSWGTPHNYFFTRLLAYDCCVLYGNLWMRLSNLATTSTDWYSHAYILLRVLYWDIWRCCTGFSSTSSDTTVYRSFFSESFSPHPCFRHFFCAIFQSSIFSTFIYLFFQVSVHGVKFNELVFFASGEFHE